MITFFHFFRATLIHFLYIFSEDQQCENDDIHLNSRGADIEEYSNQFKTFYKLKCKRDNLTID